MCYSCPFLAGGPTVIVLGLLISNGGAEAV